MGSVVIEFIEALARHTFLQYAMMASLLASVACGVVGTYVVTRRISYIAGGIAHSVLGGMGVAHYLNAVHGWAWLQPIHGAAVAAIAAAITIGWVTLNAREREDTVIGAIWAIGMAVGVIFISMTPGYNSELMSYLFGNILMVAPGDLWLMAGLDAIVLILVYLFYNQFMAVCFDEPFARARGVNATAYYLLLLCLTALTVVILVTVVGIVMVIALLTLPAAVAGHFSRSLWRTMLTATGFCMMFTAGGLALSYGPDFPAGASIVLLAGGVYLVVTVASRFIRK